MKHLPPTAMRSNGADYLRTYHHVSVDADVTLEDILRPSFWAHHTQALRKGDLIDVLSDVLDVQVRVEEKGIGFVKVRPRLLWAKETQPKAVEAPEPLPELPAGYEIKKGPGGRLRVFQKDPHMEVSTKTFVTEREAIGAACAHYQMANAVA